MTDWPLFKYIFIPVSKFAGERFGSTACSLSRVAIYPYVVFGCLFHFYLLSNNKIPIYLAIIAVMVVLLMGFIWWIQAEKADLSPNPFSLEPAFMRIMWFPLFVLNTGDFSPLFFSNIAIICVMYFRAVPAPPPKRKKKKVAAQLAFQGQI